MRRCPLLFEVNARILVERQGPDATLLDVPAAYWQSLAARGVDLVWLMGVWQRSAGSRRVALAEPGLRAAYDEALPGWTDDDVGGSPYAIAAYELDTALGAPDDLAEVRRRINAHGMKLIVDFVPNHLALDHPLTTTLPQCFVGADAARAAAEPGTFFRAGDRWLAHGRDPYFAPWTDTVQVNAFADAGRTMLVDALRSLAECADGVRCDMAMLLLNEVFERTWSGVLDGVPPPRDELWTVAIDAVRGVHPEFFMIAEAYWDLGWRLHELGFDAFYDKTLYDRLRDGAADGVRAHLGGTAHWDCCGVRFVENHDEPRVASAFGDAALPAAVVAMTVPGIRLLHDGQIEGRRRRLPVQLVREPREDADPRIVAAYERLLRVTDEPVFHEGSWRLLDVEALDGSPPPLAWSWRLDGGAERLVVVNLVATTASCRIRRNAEPPPRDQLDGRVAGPAAMGPRITAEGDGVRVELGPHSACII